MKFSKFLLYIVLTLLTLFFCMNALTSLVMGLYAGAILWVILLGLEWGVVGIVQASLKRRRKESR